MSLEPNPERTNPEQDRDEQGQDGETPGADDATFQGLAIPSHGAPPKALLLVPELTEEKLLAVLDLAGYEVPTEVIQALFRTLVRNAEPNLAALQHQMPSVEAPFTISLIRDFTVRSGKLTQDRYKIEIADALKLEARPLLSLRLAALTGSTPAVELEVELPAIHEKEGLLFANSLLDLWDSEPLCESRVDELRRRLTVTPFVSISSLEESYTLLFLQSLAPEVEKREPDGIVPLSVLLPNPSLLQVSTVAKLFSGKGASPVTDPFLSAVFPFSDAHDEIDTAVLWQASKTLQRDLKVEFKRRLLVGELTEQQEDGEEESDEYGDGEVHGETASDEHGRSPDTAEYDEVDLDDIEPPRILSSVSLRLLPSKARKSPPLLNLLSTGEPFTPLPNLGRRWDSQQHTLLIDLSISELPASAAWGEVWNIAKSFGSSFSVDRARKALREIASGDEVPERARYCEGGMIVEVEIG